MIETDAIWKTEGPTDLLALLSANPDCEAFTTANGASERPEEWISEIVKDQQVSVVHDTDQTGQDGALWKETPDGKKRPGWCPFLAKSAREVRNVVLDFVDDGKEKNDLRDYFNDGRTFEDLNALAESSEPITDLPKEVAEYLEEDEDDPHRLARINLKNYQDGHGGRLVFWRDEWWKWKAGKWRRIEIGEFRAKLNMTIRSEFERCWRENKGGGNSKVRKVSQSLLTNTIRAHESLSAIPYSVEMPCWLPTRKRRNLFSMKNGILDLDAILEGRPFGDWFAPHSSDWFSPLMVDYEFDKDADCPLWLEYLDYSMNGDEELMNVLQEWAGYLLLADNRFQKFLVLEGEGGDGKTVFFAAMRAMLGNENVSSVSVENFGGRFDLSSTLGKAANITGDIGEIENLAEGVLKQFTGGDVMFFDRKNKQPISARPTAKLMASWNTRPRIKDRSRGLWRRMLIVPFNRQIPEDRKVTGMDLESWWIDRGEVPGILMWAIVGLDRLLQQGRFTDPEASQKAILEYQLESNPAKRFLLEYVQKMSGDRLEEELKKREADQKGISCDDLYEKYKSWCASEGISTLAKQNFGKQVRKEFGDLRTRRPGGIRSWFYRTLELCDDF